MRDTVLFDQLKDLCRVALAQADVDPGRSRDGPRKAPAVAMEHRQGPEIDRMLAEIAGENVADGIKVSAAVVGDDAFRVACRARGVAERDGVPFVLRQACNETLIALRQ